MSLTEKGPEGKEEFCEKYDKFKSGRTEFESLRGKASEEVHLCSQEGCVGILSSHRWQLSSGEKIRSFTGIMGRGSRAEA